MNYEALLSHSDFVRGLARSLIHDENTVDDVVQETFIAALNQEEGKIRSAPAWLAAVTRNFARLSLRGESRRRTRERAAARPEAQASTESVVQREAVRRQVVETVLGLKEPYRSAILFRFYENLPPREIARRLGQPSATVRSHLRRGLEQMRSKLDGLYHDDRKAWCVALAPVAGMKAVLPTTTAVSSGLLLGWLLKISAAFIFLGGLIYLGWLVQDDPKTVRPKSNPALASPAESAALPPIPSGEAVERVAVLPEKSDTGILIRGRLVFKGEDTPVAGVELEPNFPDSDMVIETVTNQEGVFTFSLTEPAFVHSIGIHVGEETVETVIFHKQYLQGNEEELLLELPRAGSVRGRVIDPDGFAVPYARILGWCGYDEYSLAKATRTELGEPDRVAQADADGYFLMENLGVAFLLTAEAENWLCRWRLKGKLKSNQEVEGLTLTMGPVKTCRGRVLSPNGMPLAGVKVKAANSYFRNRETVTRYPDIARITPCSVETVTDAQGRFRLSPMAPVKGVKGSSPYKINIRHLPYQRWSHHPEDLDQPMEIVLSGGLTLAGRISDLKGRAIGGARVGVYNQANVPEVTTDEEGVFKVLGLFPSVKSKVSIHAPGYAITLLEPFTIHDDQANFLEVALSPECSISGRVLDPSGKPVPDTALRLKGDRLVRSEAYHNRTWEEWLDVNKTRTDAQGRFFFGSLYAGEYTVFAVSDKNPDLSVEVQTRSGESELEIVLDSAAMRKVVLCGSVMDAHTGCPVSRFSVTPMREITVRDDFNSSMGEPIGFQDMGGVFEIAGLSPGEIGISVSAEGYVGQSVPRKNYPVGKHTFAFSLIPARTLSVRVLDDQGDPLQGAHLQYREGETLWPAPEKRYTLKGNETTNQDGEAVLSGLPATWGVLWVFPRAVRHPLPFAIDLRNEYDGIKEVRLGSLDRLSLNIVCLATTADLKSCCIGEEDQEKRKQFQDLKRSGACWPLDRPATLRVLYADGSLFQELSVRRGENHGYEIDDGYGSTRILPAQVFRLSVPRESLTIEASASGHDPVVYYYEPESRESSGMNNVQIVLFFRPSVGGN